LSVYKLRGNFTVSVDSLANLDIQFDGELVGFWWSVMADLDADLEQFNIETSFLSSNTSANNDARGSICQIAGRASGTPGFVISRADAGLSGLRIPVIAGERIHMHGILQGTGAVDATNYLYVNDRADPRLRRRR